MDKNEIAEAMDAAVCIICSWAFLPHKRLYGPVRLVLLMTY